MSDWDESDKEVAAAPSKPTISVQPPIVAPRSSKFAGEDEEDEGDDWDASSDEDKSKPIKSITAPRKKGTLKAKLAEKAALAASGATTEDDLIDETTPQERRRREAAKKMEEKMKEQEADLAHAADLLGLKDEVDQSTFSKANPKSADEYRILAQQLHHAYIERLQSKPMYTTFVDEMIKCLLSSLTDVEARKVNSAVGVIANTKTQEAKDAKSGKKKGTGSKAKPVLGANKGLASKTDTNMYDEALDDEELDFM